jgi:hypothetical protein
MDPTAIKAPERARSDVTPAFNGTATVAVHVISVDIPFGDHERWMK